jgi:hypothetical protein
MPFFGSRYDFNKGLAVSAEFGYSYISLKSDSTSLSGPEFVFNIWLSVYPFEFKKAETMIEKPVAVQISSPKITPIVPKPIKVNLRKNG